MKSVFVNSMIVNYENLTEIRNKFFKGEKIEESEIDAAILITPYHKDINWGVNRLTLLPWTALEHLHFAIKDTINRGVEGDFIETGVWRGGACILAKSIYNEIAKDRKVYVADSFEGLPKPDGTYQQDANDRHYLDDMLKVSLETVKNSFEQFDLIDDKIIFVKGWFKDTMPGLDIEKISILRLDGDMYESTIQVLSALYHKLSSGGYCIVDDYHHASCRQAVSDFRHQNNITEQIHKVDNDPNNEVHYWIKK